MSSAQNASVVVVGGGFAGVACAKHLAKHGVRVTLIDRHDYNQFQPLLYQVATAQVETSDVARPLRTMFAKRHRVDDHDGRHHRHRPGRQDRHQRRRHRVLGGLPRPRHGHRTELLRHARRRHPRVPALLRRRCRSAPIALAHRARGRATQSTPHRPGRPELRDRRARARPAWRRRAPWPTPSIGSSRPGSATSTDATPRVYRGRSGARGARSVLGSRPRVRQGRARAAGRPARAGHEGDRGSTRSRATLRRTRDPHPHRRVGGRHQGRRSGRPRRPAPRRERAPRGRPRPHGRRASGGVRARRRGQHARTRRQAASPARLGRAASRAVRRRQHPRRHRGEATAAVPLPRQGDHGDDRPQRGGRRDGTAAARAPRRAPPYASWLGVHAWLLGGVRDRVSALGSWGWDYVANTRASAYINRPDATRIEWDE